MPFLCAFTEGVFRKKRRGKNAKRAGILILPSTAYFVSDHVVCLDLWNLNAERLRWNKFDFPLLQTLLVTLRSTYKSYISEVDPGRYTRNKDIGHTWREVGKIPRRNKQLKPQPFITNPYLQKKSKDQKRGFNTNSLSFFF